MAVISESRPSTLMLLTRSKRSTPQCPSLTGLGRVHSVLDPHDDADRKRSRGVWQPMARIIASYWRSAVKCGSSFPMI